MAVAMDENFFKAIGGASANLSHDVNEGDIIWLAVGVSKKLNLEVRYWEVLPLEESITKLLAAERIKRPEFEKVLRNKLQPLDRAKRKR